MSKICDICGGSSPDEAKFCRKCGKQNFSNSNAENNLEINEDDFYEQAWLEVENSTQIKKLWAKAFVQCDGDEEKTKVMYLKFRVENLKKEAEEKLNLSQQQFKKQPINVESEDIQVQNLLESFLKKNGIHVSKKISNIEYIVSHQSTPIDSTIKYINGTWRIK